MTVWADNPRQGFLTKEGIKTMRFVFTNSIFRDEPAMLPAVAECYEIWSHLRDELERYYKDAPRQRLPMSRQKEFKAVKNMVIREAEHLRLGVFTFEDEQI